MTGGNEKMSCPNCGGKLYCKGVEEDSKRKYRARKCTNCGLYVYTVETIGNQYRYKYLKSLREKRRKKTRDGKGE